jgi:hypothetical protein
VGGSIGIQVRGWVSRQRSASLLPSSADAVASSVCVCIGAQVWLDAWGNALVDPSFVERSWIQATRTSLSAHRMASYRRGLIFARRHEGLPQYRLWAEQRHFGWGQQQQPALRMSPLPEEEGEGAGGTAAGSGLATSASSVGGALEALAGMQQQWGFRLASTEGLSVGPDTGDGGERGSTTANPLGVARGLGLGALSRTQAGSHPAPTSSAGVGAPVVADW